MRKQSTEAKKGFHGGRVAFSTWIEPHYHQAVRVAAAKADTDMYLIVEEALRRHPLVKKELADAQ